MSDCLEMCLSIIDSGVSIGTNAWGVCVYSISGGQNGVNRFYFKIWVFFFVKLFVLVLIVEDLMVIMNIFLSLIWIYGLVCYIV